jgi:hypothetical protein
MSAPASIQASARAKGHRAGRAVPYLSGVLASALLTLPLVPPPFSEEWFRRPLADDAYYYLVIARNVARGSGITFGGLPTSGFQPLYLMVCWIVGSIAAWNPIAVPMAVTIVNWLLYNGLGTWLVFRLWRRLHPEHRDKAIGLLAPFLWLVSPSGQSMSLNGMETTLGLLSWLAVALVVSRRGFLPNATRSSVAIGLALGIAFLARNDAVVLSAGYAIVCAALLFGAPEPGVGSPSSRNACRSALVTLGVALCCAIPWLIYNEIALGSLIPQGGRAEMRGGIYDFGRAHQLNEVIEAMVRNLSPLPLPLGRLSAGLRIPVELAMVGAVLGVVLLFLKFGRARFRRLCALLGSSIFFLAAVYSTLFGAGHMARRWLAPCIVLGVMVTAEVMEFVHRRKPALGRAAIPALIAVLVAGRVGWVCVEASRAFPTNTWGILQYLRSHEIRRPIGAFQAGLLSWVLPDVINLDGKTNPDALRALSLGRFGPWLAGSRVESVVDTNLLGTDGDPTIRSTFRVLRTDEGIILLERKHE